MSLGIVAVTPGGIVVGVDSAVTSQSQGQEYSLAGYPKILDRDDAVQTIAFVGDMRIGEQGRDSWFYAWLHKFLRDVASSPGTMETATELAGALNTEALPYGQHHDVILAAWEGEKEEDRRPTVWEVSTGPERGEYKARQRLAQSDADVIVKARQQAGPEFPVFFFHMGVPPGLVSWLVHEARPMFSELIGAPVPHPSVEGMEEFVRFVLNIAGDLYWLAGSQRYVSGPFTTTILLPHAANAFTRRR